MIAVAFSLVAERRRRKFSHNVGFARAARALRNADKKLNAGRKHFSNGRYEQGFAKLSAALDGYSADKMNVSPLGLTVEAIDEFLDGRDVDDETRQALRSVFAARDQARYASAGLSADTASDTLERAWEALRTLEKGHKG